jgi:DNA-binding transcriptional LysR family regulator
MVLASAVLSGLAVSVLPESALQPGMRILTAKEGFPDLPDAEIALIRSTDSSSKTIDAMANHMRESLGGVIALADCVDNTIGRNGSVSPVASASGCAG